jgi:hypothetical protein
MSKVELHIGLHKLHPAGRARAWVVTFLASVGTAYGLDLFATCVGLLLAGSGWLSGLDYAAALGLLGVSYVAWGAGIWSILGANWELLQRSGTSTNLFSKAGHDLVVRFGWSLRWRRLATHAGYVATDLAKEAPYYLGAAGAALFSDQVGAIDAIIFLAGANTGAAAYGFMQAYGMRIVVRRCGRGE